MLKKKILIGLAAFLLLAGQGCVSFSKKGSGAMGVFRSGDKGESWQPAFTLLTDQGIKSIGLVKAYKFFTDPSDPNALYLGSRGQGLFYSYNNGQTWQLAKDMQGKFIYALAVDPRDKCNIYASDGGHIYKTDDCARTWKMVFTEERPDQRLAAVAVDAGDSKTIYGAELGGDVLRSRDSGASWRIVHRFGVDTRYLLADPAKPGRLYAATLGSGLFRSDDNGNSWQDMSKPLENFSGSKDFYKLILNPAQANSLFWISKYGILRSDDSGETWVDLKLLTPPGSVNIYAFAVNPQNQSELYYTGTILGEGGANARSTFYKSVDGGKNWVTRKLPTNTIPVDMLAHKKSGNTLFLGFTTADK
ncbi:hypothetical protein EPN28_03625 [Patescibacteria group bacterium]|nr:MAG: hypothetical protein EPN28_03625 [Patescibacteria group bacterium]